MKNNLLFLAVAAFALPLSSPADTFDGGTGVLSIPSVTVGTNTYVNVLVRLDRYAVLAATGPVSGGGVPCDGAANLSYAKVSAVGVGMTLDQVSQVLGCDFNPSQTATVGGLVRYMWATPSLDVWVKVFFNAATLKVSSLVDTSKIGIIHPVCSSGEVCR